jgi:hypothetical protein
MALNLGTCGAELDGVGDQSQRRAGRPDPRAAAHVLLEDVVLDRARELGPVDALLLADGDVEGEQDRAVPLIVMLVEMASRGILSKRSSKSASESMATPTRPTSSSTSGSSES